MTNSLEGKVIAVIGASSGIGEGIARAVAELKPQALILAARREEELNRISLSLKTETMVIKTDVTDHESIENLVTAITKKYGHLDVVINSAGVIQGETLIEETPIETIDQIINTNLRSVLLVAKEIAPYFKKQGEGIYLVISSQAGKFAFSHEAPYCSSKSGADHAIRALNLEWENHKNIYAFSLQPGFINTEEAKRQFPNEVAEIEKSISPSAFGEIVASYILHPHQKYTEGGPVHLIKTGV